MCTGSKRAAVLALFALSAGAAAAPRQLTLDDAIALALQHQPSLRQAHFATAAARARADEARAPLLPQLVGTAGYSRSTGNFAASPGFLPRGTMIGASSSSFDSFNFFTAGLSLNQFIWDFGQTTDRFYAARESAASQLSTERATRLQIVLGVRTAYFAARAERDLVTVAAETLANLERHLVQIEGMVRVGQRPEIDLAQARSDRATAEATLITTENAYAIARAQLNLAIGVEGRPDFDVPSGPPPSVSGEDLAPEALADEALRARPEMAALEEQVRAQKLTLSSLRGGYGPALGATVNLTDRGGDITNLAWNWSAGVNLTWPIFSGLLTRSQISEQDANLLGLLAQRDGLRQSILLELEQASLGVRAAKATLRANDEALANARIRLQLAEGRYTAGVGNVIELGDAQVALTNAAAQRTQADFNLSTARSQLLHALGRAS